MNYKILGADVAVKQLDQLRYLTAYLDTYNVEFTEPGPPMLLILANTDVFTNDGAEISDDVLQALLAEQNDNFITVYSNIRTLILTKIAGVFFQQKKSLTKLTNGLR